MTVFFHVGIEHEGSTDTTEYLQGAIGRQELDDTRSDCLRSLGGPSACHDRAVAWITANTLCDIEPRVPQRCLKIEQVILVAPGLCGFHEREQYGGEVLDDRRPVQ
jgi:hypothetical protein